MRRLPFNPVFHLPIFERQGNDWQNRLLIDIEKDVSSRSSGFELLLLEAKALPCLSHHRLHKLSTLRIPQCNSLPLVNGPSTFRPSFSCCLLVIGGNAGKAGHVTGVRQAARLGSSAVRAQRARVRA